MSVLRNKNNIFTYKIDLFLSSPILASIGSQSMHNFGRKSPLWEGRGQLKVFKSIGTFSGLMKLQAKCVSKDNIFDTVNICHGKVERRRSSWSSLSSLIFPFMEQDH